MYESRAQTPPGSERGRKPGFQVCKPYSESSIEMRYINMTQKYLPLSAAMPRIARFIRASRQVV